MPDLRTRVPPPLVTLLTALTMWLATLAWPGASLPATPRRALAAVLAIAGISCAAAGIAAFRRAKTTVDPVHPQRAAALVTHGVYRYTRNPMYVGLLLVLLAWAVFLAQPATLLGPLAFVLYIGRFQIRPEEAALQARFGTAYDRYRRAVRRWV